ncbi:MAG TPA: hypothetical protein VJ997_09945, partial [Longimicrobiales bacterium]|nr:hypothetical protein [Longimicrobiales bacterium]
MSGAAVDRETERKANDLYWGSQSSVNQIAEELDLSKGTLYGLIRPLPSGLSCPDCSEEAVYPNRTARERSLVACPSCGWEGDEREADGGAGDGSVTLPDAADDVDDVAPPPV